MKILRIIVGLYACICIVGAYALFQHSRGNAFLALYIIINTSLLLAGFILERGRYKPTTTPTIPDEWQLTGERFIDDSTGKTMEVRYNPKTGERNYIEVKK